MKKNKSGVACRPFRRKGRSGWILENDRIALGWLRGGGHLESVTIRNGPVPNLNLLWEAKWKTIEPWKYSSRKHERKFGPPPSGKYLAGYTGHALCVDYFGAPSDEEALLGLPLHGEIASSRWSLVKKSTRRGLAQLSMRSTAPAAGLRVQRDVALRENESVAYVTETISNVRNCDRYIQWAQHSTFGPPFLQAGESVCLMPGTRSRTWPLGYEGKGALENDREFDWPNAPAEIGPALDISKPFSTTGRGFVATTLSADDPQSPFTYAAVLNWRLGLLAGYCFRRSDYPWVVSWEENCARSGAPWDGKAQVRGMEFATSPLPLGMREAILTGPVFGVPTLRRIPARSQQRASYAIFVAEVPKLWRTISGIKVRENAFEITGPNPGDRIELAATVLDKVWPDQRTKSERPPSGRAVTNI